MPKILTPLLVTGLILAGCTPENESHAGFRAAGTEPFWGLHIDHHGLRFTTPDDLEGIHFPPLIPIVDGNGLRWSGTSAPHTIDARIWPGACSDLMSDKLWTHTATVEIDGVTYRGCAEIPVEPSDAHDPIGDWIIVHHRMPGISAMDYDQAVSWHGRSIQLGPELAVSGDNTCRQPDYRHQRVADDDYLRRQFNITAASLGLQEFERLGLTEIYCGDDRWTAPGALLIWPGERTPYTVWDGVFFELRRAPEQP